jgi:hypothetical protein
MSKLIVPNKIIPIPPIYLVKFTPTNGQTFGLLLMKIITTIPNAIIINTLYNDKKKRMK